MHILYQPVLAAGQHQSFQFTLEKSQELVAIALRTNASLDVWFYELSKLWLR